MKDQFISFETAKLAKEKSYSCGMRHGYVQYHKKYVYDGDETHPESYEKDEVQAMEFYVRNNDKIDDTSNKHYTLYEKPTQSLLQKWLREKGIIVLVQQTINDEYYFTINKQDSNHYYRQLTQMQYGELALTKYHKSYEEALENGLIHCLNLL